MKDRTVGFVGGGRITAIFLEALEGTGLTLDRVTVSDTSAEVLAKRKERFEGITTTPDNGVAAGCERVFLALHPPAAKAALPDVSVSLHFRDDLAGIAFVCAVDLPHTSDCLFLMLAPGILLLQMLVNEVIKAGQRLQADLAAEFIESWNPAFTIADQIQREDIEFSACRIQVRHRQIL